MDIDNSFLFPITMHLERFPIELFCINLEIGLLPTVQIKLDNIQTYISTSKISS